ncbi:hypothetical protein BAMBUS_00960 [Brevundimonas phage vB_BpoS-Bambus]|nr:hypothetical protein BAMBUS_00960 [Brevundimonas phage vB_BpoS-Bambus]
MTTIAELLEQTPARMETGIEMLVGSRYNHVQEVEDHHLYGLIYNADFCPRVEQHIFHEAVYDYRRSWALFGVRFNGAWVMLCSNAGRELDDYTQRQVLDAEAYVAMIAYIRSELVRHGETPLPEVTPLDTEVQFTFYGHDVREPHYHF